MSESETVTCRSSNTSFLHIISETDEIRSKCNLDSYEELKKEMEAFAKNQKNIEAFTELRGISQFIMDIHKQYYVKLTEETENSDLLLDIIRNILCKYTNRIQNIQNHTLTLPSQCTIVYQG